MKNKPQISDLDVFCVVVESQSFVGAASELGVSPAFISKRIQILEKTLDCKLLNRSTRNISLTEDGKYIYEQSRRILVDLEYMTEALSSKKDMLAGNIHITCGFSLGRQYIAPLLSQLLEHHPKLKLQLNTLDTRQNLLRSNIDLDIRVGNDLDPNVIARRLAPSIRILCAAPSYVERKGEPESLEDLHDHQCLFIKKTDYPLGTWKLENRNKEHTIKLRPHLSSNNSEIIKLWTLQGHGIMMHSLWDVLEYLKQGELQHVMPDFWERADIFGVYPARLTQSSKVKACLDYSEEELVGMLPLEEIEAITQYSYNPY